MGTDVIRAPSATTYTVDDLVSEVRSGRVRIPMFQRDLKWQWEDVRRLFDSIVRGYPIGSLLLWARHAEAEVVRLGALEVKAPEFDEALWVVDGQQRITSLANALSDEGLDDPRFALAYDLREGDGALTHFKKPDPRDDLRIPLPVLFDLRKLLKWFADRPAAAEHLEDASRITKTIREYAVPAYVVRHPDESVLRDIFDRMNNYGKRLTLAEVFSAIQPGEDSSERPLERIADAIDARLGFGRIDEDTVLRAVLVRRGPDVTREIRTEFQPGMGRDFDGESRDDAYRGTEDALARAVSFLQQDAAVPHLAFLPYRYLLVVLTRFFAHHPNPKRQNRKLLRRWFWRAAMVGPSVSRGAYTSAMRTLAACIRPGDESASVESLLRALSGFSLSFAMPEAFRSTTAEVRFVLCALWERNPRSPASGAQYEPSDLSLALNDQRTASSALGLLFPREPMARSRLGNRVFLLADDTPEDLLGVLEGATGAQKKKRRVAILESHVISPETADLVTNGNADDFLTAREENIGAIARDFLSRMSEAEFEDTPPLDDLDLDDEDPESMSHASP